MSHARITRRELIKTAGVAVPLLGASLSASGQGDLDYRQFVSLAIKRTPKAPLILEYVGPENCQQALQHLQNALRDAGTP